MQDSFTSETENTKNYKEYFTALRNCKEDILNSDNGISTQYEARNLDGFLSDMAAKHGFNTVATLIVNHVNNQSWDGRYSPDVKNWIKNNREMLAVFEEEGAQMYVKNDRYTLDSTHPVIVNFACRWVMENEKNKEQFKPKSEKKTTSRDLLINKLHTEQDAYKSWLMEQTPEEILHHTYEFTVREDIIFCIEQDDISDDFANALLESPCPLDDIFKDFNKRDNSYMEDIRDTIEGRAKYVMKNPRPEKNFKDETKG